MLQNFGLKLSLLYISPSWLWMIVSKLGGTFWIILVHSAIIPWHIIILLPTASSGIENTLCLPGRISTRNAFSLVHTTFDGTLECWQPQEFVSLSLCSTNPLTFWTLKNKCILGICKNIWGIPFNFGRSQSKENVLKFKNWPSHL